MRLLAVGALTTALLVAGCSDDGGDSTTDATNDPAPSSTSAVPSTPAPSEAAPTSAAPTTAAPTSLTPSAGPTASRSATTPSAAPSAATPTRGASNALPSLGQVSTVARAVNLRASDLRGFTAAPGDAEPDSPAVQAAEKRFNACLGFPNANVEDGFPSQDFSNSDEPPFTDISSSVGRDRPASAVGTVRAFGTAKGAACFGPSFDVILQEIESESPGLTTSNAKVVALPVSRGAADAAGAVRATATLSGDGQSLPLTVDFAVLAKGGYTVTLLALGSGETPDASQFSTLLRTLSQRLAAAAG